MIMLIRSSNINGLSCWGNASNFLDLGSTVILEANLHAVIPRLLLRFDESRMPWHNERRAEVIHAYNGLYLLMNSL